MTLTDRHQPTPRHRPGWYADYQLLDPGLADALRQARLDRCLSLREAARAAGIDHSYLLRLERGERCPRVGVAVRLAAVLGLDDDLATELIDASVEDPWADK